MRIVICYLLLSILVFVFKANASVIPPGIDDFEIAKKYYNFKKEPQQQTFDKVQKSQGEILYPTPNTTWHVGERVHVTFKPKTKDQTVDIFFFNKTTSLAHGSLDKTTSFSFTVPPEAKSSGHKGTSLLLAVRRRNNYLQTVDSVVLHVRP